MKRNVTVTNYLCSSRYNTGIKTCEPTEELRRTIQGVSRLVDITAGGDFLGLCDEKSS